MPFAIFVRMRCRIQTLFIVSVFLSNSPLVWSADAFLQKFSNQDVETVWKMTNESISVDASTIEHFSTAVGSNGVLYPEGAKWIGMCFEPKKNECTVDEDYSKALEASLSKEQFNPEEISAALSFAKGIRMHSVTTYRMEGEKLIATNRTEFFKNGNSFGHPYIKEVSMVVSSVPFRFAAKGSADERSRCSEFEKVPPQIQNLADSVVQIIGKSDEEGLGGGGAQGSGFFISESGFLLTNHHVIHAMPAACAEEMKCTLHFRQILGAGKVREFDAPITLETESKAQDFALLKVKLPAEVKVHALALETDKAGPEVFTVGYPSDRQAESGTALTYSSGHLNGMMGTTVTSNVYIAGGASGSPLLSSASMKIIGIMSNSVNDGNGTFEASLARPIASIEKSHQVSQYLTGEKQQRIDKIIGHINASLTPEEAQRWMNAFEAENTLYGISKLEEALYSNASKEVRKVILKGLQKQGMVRGTIRE